ncbi:hypothetical protein AB0C51_17615 [Streptomyces pathocidini]|uniref:hypothetical protein n=1 Tax=Streptomyces pathocidini TaxID=1650571 RepID=UPI0033C5CFDC
MFRRRREPVPFAFVVEADRFRSNVEPPPRPRAGAAQIAGRTLIGLTAAAALVGALLLGMPAMESGPHSKTTQHSEAAEGR